MEDFHPASNKVFGPIQCCCLAGIFVFFIAVGLADEPTDGSLYKMDSIVSALRDAQLREDRTAVLAIVSQAVTELGNRAGEPEVAEKYRKPPANVEPLSSRETTEGFEPFYRHILKTKWWRIGENPRQSVHPLRDTASVVVGCVYAYRAKCKHSEELLSLATDAAEYLVWTQQQAGRGLFPFPANRGGDSKAFSAARKFMQKAERENKLPDIEANGWIVNDLGDGGLQFDNGVCGVALMELFRVTRDERFLDASKRAGEWAIRQPVVPNWNYNSFSVYLLAELARTTGEAKWRDAAVKKAHLGIYPGQLTDGKNKGRWFDPHNARLTYHYILVRSLVSLTSCLERESAEWKQSKAALVLALQSRNEDFVNLGVANVESAFESLLLLEQYFPQSELDIGEARQAQALRTLESFCVAKLRAKQPPVAPGAWGLYLYHLRAVQTRMNTAH